MTLEQKITQARKEIKDAHTVLMAKEYVLFALLREQEKTTNFNPVEAVS